jgi:NADH-quinone oxidoreductase subunit J
MADWFFYLFAGLTLVSGLLVVANPFNRNPVTSAMFLVLTIVFLAGLFVLLQAYFLAAIQILVYAGAVMVLFLFVIMLLDLPEEERSQFRRGLTVLAIVAVAGLLGLMLKAFLYADWPARFPGAVESGDPLPLGRLLFEEYLLPFEIVSVLLLVAMVGVILLSKRELK